MPDSWASKWENEKQLGEGGQGATFLVRSKSDASHRGVLKLLVPARKQDAKSRQRMHQEVGNLQIASATTAKVPKVLDSNTHEYATEGLELYFVMEYIEGESLEDLMKREKILSSDEAFELAIDLSKTLLSCHDRSIMHRDLKPANILIRGRKPIDAVIVDYGLSFNEQEVEQNDLTSQGEPIGNSFTDLPERRTPDAQRHYESDLTAVCGIFYYCVTGQRPTPFRDAFGFAPHRRKQAGLSLREAMKDHPAAARLEVVFDRAFEPIISDRFSSAAELIDRLLHAKSATAVKEPKSIDDILKAHSSQLISASRKMQLQKYSETAEKVIRTCENELGRTRSGSNFQLNGIRAPSNVQFTFAADMSSLNKGFALGVTVVGLNEISAVEFAFAAQGTQTAILRRRMKIVPPTQLRAGQMGGFIGMTVGNDPQTAYIQQLVRKPVTPYEDWEVRLWYPAEGQPTDEELIAELSNCIEIQIDELTERLR